MHLRRGLFDGHGGELMQYEAHRPMQHDQGFTGSHWTPPSGYYSSESDSKVIFMGHEIVKLL
jgi:hypothetical protein